MTRTTSEKRGLIGVGIAVGVRAETPPAVTVTLEVAGVGRAFVTLTGDQFTRMLAGSMLNVPVTWERE